LKEFSKPFQLDFTQIIDNYKQESIKNTKTSIDNLENEAEKDETDKSKNLFDIIVSVGAENINEEMN
jgi:cytoskeletal protein RodZ